MDWIRLISLIDAALTDLDAGKRTGSVPLIRMHLNDSVANIQQALELIEDDE